MKDAVAVFDKLDVQHPNAWTELHFTNPYELLAATILSAQCTDARVNQVTPALFKKYPTPARLAKADVAELETMIQPTGFFRMKTRSLIGMASAVVDAHGGEIPSDMDALVALPGVGRKTANVVRGHAFNLPGLPVDRHVLRVATRIGLISAKAGEDAVKAEKRLMTLLPPDRWTRASDTLILHGRRICKPKPLCERCAIRASCAYYRRQ
ncbi:MAG TPA: endonuclease III [Vicinamibacterales bacterium]|jgi:endonuclease-3|nr:endonuclease III [Acidobacteriota bacterium]HQX82238.1 endonuclease III [Vicinamibacterales bacterium]